MGKENEINIRKTRSGLIAWLDEYKRIEIRMVERKGTKAIGVLVPDGWIVQRAFGGRDAPFMMTLRLTKAVLEWAVKEKRPVLLSISQEDRWEFSLTLEHALRNLVHWRE